MTKKSGKKERKDEKLKKMMQKNVQFVRLIQKPSPMLK